MVQGEFWRLLGQALSHGYNLDPRIRSLVSHLLELEGVEETTAVETACLYFTSHGEVRLAVNPHFIKRYVKEPQDALFVFLHELAHQENREFLDVAVLRRDEDEMFVFNLASDMLINRRLERAFFPGGVGVLERLYPPDTFPSVLLASPRSLEERVGPFTWENLKALFAGFGKCDPYLATQCYLLSLRSDTSVYDLARLLRKLMPPRKEVMLLGSHGLEDLLRDWPEHVLGDVFEALRERMYSRKKLKEKKYDLEPTFPFYHQQEAWKLVRAIERAITDPVKPYRHKRATYAERMVAFAPSRRELFLLAGGCTPAFYDVRVVGRGVREDGVHLYVDVSGSVMEILPFIYSLLGDIKDELACDRVFLFSTGVREVPLGEFLKGKVITGFGTDFDCVMDHARSNQARRILMITDGYGNLSQRSLDWIKRANVSLFLVLVGEVSPFFPRRRGLDTWNTPLIGVAEEVWGLRQVRKRKRKRLINML